MRLIIAIAFLKKFRVPCNRCKEVAERVIKLLADTKIYDEKSSRDILKTILISSMYLFNSQ